jgi:hypothetical protein
MHPNVLNSLDIDFNNNIYCFLTVVTMVSNVVLGYSIQWTFIAPTAEFPAFSVL